jgi:hypothetical protein
MVDLASLRGGVGRGDPSIRLEVKGYELRIYHRVPGHMPPLLLRFENETLRIRTTAAADCAAIRKNAMTLHHHFRSYLDTARREGRYR